MVRYLTIHGHFYQPPRENPYLEKIETQESAFPYHDWNARINDECYRPNTCSRVLGGYGKIVDIINNYEYMSFNFGPTLLGWLEKNDVETYQKIIEADRRSRDHNHGHGNALAQVYNHIIMPLASWRDKLTQIRWGIDDFRRHFGRDPEGMWLAETAINMETVSALIECGIRFTILSPFQAEKVRTFFSNTWQNVEDGSIDPTQPYRIFVDDDPTKYLDVFFYDAPISTAVSFEHILRDSNEFARRLSQAAMPKEGRPTLIHIATDGESYGHHEPFGDMCLAYFFKTLAKEYNFKLINYAHFLELHAPVSEVVLKHGFNGEGTAWSCSHGVGRWKEDCGCSTYAGHGWNQKWRAPLRDGLNALRDELWTIYVKETSPLVHNPETVRNDYYHLFSGDISEDDFLTKHAKKKLSPDKVKDLLTMLEIQRFSQLMFTSCGWFFADISGIETVQVIKYANVAIRYAKAYTSKDLEKLLLSFLKQAISNMGPAYNGDVIYEKWIKPYELDEMRAVNQYLMEGEFFGPLKQRSVYLFNIQPEKVVRFEAEGVRYILAEVKTEHELTHTRNHLLAVLSSHEPHFHTLIHADGKKDVDQIYTALTQLGTRQKTDEYLAAHFPIRLSMNDLNFESSSELMAFLWEKKYSNLIHSLDRMFLSFRDLIQANTYMGGFLPPEIKSIVEMVLSAKYYDEIRKVEVFAPDQVGPLVDIVDMAHKLKIMVRKDRAKTFIESHMTIMMKQMKISLSKDDIHRVNQFILTLDLLDIQVNKTEPENIAFDLYRTLKTAHDSSLTKVGKEVTKLAEILNLEL